MKFEYVYDDPMYRLFNPLGTDKDPFTEVKTFRSDDPEQTYTVRIIRDKTSPTGAMFVNMIRRDGIDFTVEEKITVLDAFFPNRQAQREDNVDEPGRCRFTLLPGQSDLTLPWCTAPYIPYHSN